MRCSPYVEWYQNSVAIEGSPAARPPRRGARQPALRRLRRHVPRRPRGLAARAVGRPVPRRPGARYVVLVTKHHDGVLLWPSDIAQPAQGSAGRRERDLVGDLAGGRPGPRHALRHLLLGRARLDLRRACRSRDLAGDVPGHPAVARVPRLRRRATGTSSSTATAPTCSGTTSATRPPPTSRGSSSATTRPCPTASSTTGSTGWRSRRAAVHCDFVTPEYSTVGDPNRKWESTRGIGTSFGYNREESDDSYLAPGRARADVHRRRRPRRQPAPQRGPDGRGRHPVGAGPAPARARLVAPHQRRRHLRHPALDRAPTATTGEGHDVRFTTRDGAVYAIVCGTPSGGRRRARRRPRARRRGPPARPRRPARLDAVGDGCAVTLPGRPADAPALALRLSAVA